MENGKTAPGDHWILIRCGLHHPYELKGFEPSANYALVAMRYVCVGEDSIFPVVSPAGKQRRRIAPTMILPTFANEIRQYHVETWHILQHWYISGSIRFCSKTCHVGGRILSAPTQMVPPNQLAKNSRCNRRALPALGSPYGRAGTAESRD